MYSFFDGITIVWAYISSFRREEAGRLVIQSDSVAAQQNTN